MITISSAVLGTQYDNTIPHPFALITAIKLARLFANYNWERYDWLLKAMDRTNTATETTSPNSCTPNVPPTLTRPVEQPRIWIRLNMVSVGSEYLDLIQKIF